jgi:hypothetical protein
MKIWKEFTQTRYNCFKIKEKQLEKFFRKLGEESESLGFRELDYDDGEMKNFSSCFSLILKQLYLVCVNSFQIFMNDT